MVFQNSDNDSLGNNTGNTSWSVSLPSPHQRGMVSESGRAPSLGDGAPIASLELTKINGTIQTSQKEKVWNKCPQPIGLFINKNTGNRVPMACHKWTCPHCGKIKKMGILHRVKMGFHPDMISAGSRIRGIVLTQKLGSRRDIMRDWATFRHILVRAGYHLKYFWAKEFTKKGQRHLHALVNAYISQHVLKDAWSRATQHESWIVWITGKNHPKRSEDIYNPAGYATKYLTKSYGHEQQFDTHERRWGFSREPLFKPQQSGNIGNLTPIEVMERMTMGSPWRADMTTSAMITAYRLSGGTEIHDT